MDTIMYLVVFVFGWYARELVATYRFNRLKPRDMMRDADSIFIRVEFEHGSYYVYDSMNDSFLVQCNTQDEMKEFFKTNYANKAVLMDPDNAAKLGIS